jgi:hypothetical protein
VSIVRGPVPDHGFTIIRDQVARDERLSYRARGILLAILSRPDNWRTDSEQLAREGKEGRDAVRAALRELEAAGYIKRERSRVLAESGKLVWKTEMVVRDEAVSDDGFSGVGSVHKPAGRSDDGFPAVGNPGVGNPGVGNPGAITRTDKKNQTQNLLVASDEQDPPRPDVEHLCTVLADLIEANGEPRPTIGKRWRTDCRLMIDKDGRDPAKAENLMRWATSDPFWRGVILSMTKFRKQYGAMRQRALAEHERHHPPPTPSRTDTALLDLADRIRARQTTTQTAIEGQP